MSPFVGIMAALLAQAALEPVESLSGDDLVKTGVTADLFAITDAQNWRQAAIALADSAGLKAWNGEPLDQPVGEAAAVYAVTASDGRNVAVYYAPGRTQLCRITATRGGLTAARYREYRWCQARLGFATPAQLPAPIHTTP